MDNKERVTMLINWLSVLNEGYVKPDANTAKAQETSNTTGIVRDTKDFIPYIDKINHELSLALRVPNVDLETVNARRTKNY